jgi:hypothetical protein
MSKIISKEEAHQLGLQAFGKKHPVRASIEIMEKGQLLYIERQELKWKGQSPMLFCSSISKVTDMKFKVMNTRDKKGWVVERIDPLPPKGGV